MKTKNKALEKVLNSLKKSMLKKNLPVGRVLKVAGISTRTFWLWENGRHETSPTDIHIAKLEATIKALPAQETKKTFVLADKKRHAQEDLAAVKVIEDEVKKVIQRSKQPWRS